MLTCMMNALNINIKEDYRNKTSLLGEKAKCSELHCKRSMNTCIFLLDWGSKIAVQAFVDHTQLLVLGFCSHHWSLCQLAVKTICRVLVINENRWSILQSYSPTTVLGMTGNKHVHVFMKV